MRKHEKCLKIIIYFSRRSSKHTYYTTNTYLPSYLPNPTYIFNFMSYFLFCGKNFLMYADLRRLICRLFKLVSPFRWNNVSCDKKFCPLSAVVGWKRRITNESPRDSKSSNIYRERWRCFILMRKKEDILNPRSMIFNHLF